MCQRARPRQRRMRGSRARTSEPERLLVRSRRSSYSAILGVLRMRRGLCAADDIPVLDRMGRQVSSELLLRGGFYYIGGRRLTATFRRLPRVFSRHPSTAFPCLRAAASRTPVAGPQRLCDSRRREARHGTRAPARGVRQPVAAASAPKRCTIPQPDFSFGSLPSAHRTHRACRHLQPVAGIRIDASCTHRGPSICSLCDASRDCIVHMFSGLRSPSLTSFHSLTLIASGSPLHNDGPRFPSLT